MLAALLVVAVGGFSQVRKSFFPPSNTPMFFVDVWLPKGSDIRHTEQVVAEMDQYVLAQEGVTEVTSTIGQGALRFILTYFPERIHANYAQLLVRTEQREQIALSNDALVGIGNLPRTSASRVSCHHSRTRQKMPNSHPRSAG